MVTWRSDLACYQMPCVRMNCFAPVDNTQYKKKIVCKLNGLIRIWGSYIILILLLVGNGFSITYILQHNNEKYSGKPAWARIWWNQLLALYQIIYSWSTNSFIYVFESSSCLLRVSVSSFYCHQRQFPNYINRLFCVGFLQQ